MSHFGNNLCVLTDQDGINETANVAFEQEYGKNPRVLIIAGHGAAGRIWEGEMVYNAKKLLSKVIMTHYDLNNFDEIYLLSCESAVALKLTGNSLRDDLANNLTVNGFPQIRVRGNYGDVSVNVDGQGNRSIVIELDGEPVPFSVGTTVD